MTLRSRLVEGPSSIGARTRTRRWELLGEMFPDLSSYRVLDLGGTADSWLRTPVQPKSVTVLNLYDDELTVNRENEALPDWLTLAAGDACDPPEEIRSLDFDLAFSNSLIEHVGGAVRRQMLATVIRDSAPRYWIQTPYRYFPIEPHYLFPGYQFLPIAARARLARSWPLIHTRATSWESGVGTALDVELLSATELRYLFPDAVIHHERLLGLTKSLIAIRR